MVETRWRFVLRTALLGVVYGLPFSAGLACVYGYEAEVGKPPRGLTAFALGAVGGVTVVVVLGLPLHWCLGVFNTGRPVGNPGSPPTDRPRPTQP